MQVQKEFIKLAECQSHFSIYQSILICLLYFKHLHREYFVPEHSEIVCGKYVVLTKTDLFQNDTYNILI